MTAAYTLWVDGRPYCGEAAETEPQPPQCGAWWLQSPVQTRNGLAIGTGDPLRIESRRNLASHIERLLSRHREGKLPFSEIIIRAEI